MRAHVQLMSTEGDHTLTVKELRDKLNAWPLDAKVYITSGVGDGEYYAATFGELELEVEYETIDKR